MNRKNKAGRTMVGAGIGRRRFLAGTGGAAALVTGGLYSGALVTQAAAAATSGKPVKIGSSVPLTGFASGDGQDMMRGFQLALEEINEMGGICGRPVEHVALDAGEFAPDVMVNNFKRLITEHQVDAIIGGYQLNTGPEYDIVADAGVLYYHNNTIEANAETVRNNLQKYWMVFQDDPTERWYSLSLPGVLDTIVASGKWKPINNTIAIINANNSYSAGLTKALRGILDKTKWKIGLVEEMIVPLTEWGPTLAKIRQDPPAVIWVTDYFAGDLAAFTKQFVLDPTPSLLHEQYGPSVPEFLDLAGSAANGVMWARTIAIIQDARGKAFQQRYRDKFKEEPGFSQGGATYDATHIWWQAAAMAGGADDHKKVAAMTRRLTWRGLCGARAFDPEDQTARPYPHYTKDAGLGMPVLYFQIQDKKHVVVDPSPYNTGEFQLPPWFG